MIDTALWHAIYGLYELLIERINDESAYQAWAESHPVVFEALGFDMAASFEKRSGNRLPLDPERHFTPEPDFICAHVSTGIVTIFELKTPFVPDPVVERSDGNRQKFNEKVSSYLAQVSEYSDSIREREPAREVVKQLLKIDRISAFHNWLIYGLSDGVDEPTVARLCDLRKIPTQLVFFDRLLERLIDRYQLSRRDREPRKGGSVVYHLVLSPRQDQEVVFIADHGDELRNRLSLFLENGRLVYRCFDSIGREYRLECAPPTNVPLFLRFEYSNDQAGAYLSLNVNNEEHDLRVSSAQLEFALDLAGMKLGSDRLGRHGARFQFLESYYRTQTFNVIEKLGAFHFFKRKTSARHGCAEFDGKAYMERDLRGHLITPPGVSGPVKKETYGYTA